jgi:hypothetical protein
VEKIYYEDYSLEIKVLSTWGKNSVAGLTELQLFDCEGNLIQIKPSLIYLRNCGSVAHKKVGNLTSGVFHTNDENDMWMFLLPTAPEKAELCINFKSACGLGAVRIWNYNVESKDENNNGIKDINLYLNKSLIFNGTIFPGKGKPEDDYCTTIFLTRNSKTLALNKGNYNFFADQNLTDKIRDLRESKIMQAFSKTTNLGNHNMKEQRTIGKIHRNKNNHAIKSNVCNPGDQIFNTISNKAIIQQNITNTNIRAPKNDVYKYITGPISSYNINSGKSPQFQHCLTDDEGQSSSSINQCVPVLGGFARIPSGKSVESKSHFNKHVSLTPGKSDIDERS